MKKSKIYIVLPAYNEEASIGTLLKRIDQSMVDNNTENYKVIVVNDGSTDNTKSIVLSLQDKIPILIVDHPINLGLGPTIRDGLYKAAEISEDSDIIISMDADDTHTPGLMMRMVREIREGHDVVIASRYQRGSRVLGLSYFRRLMSFGASVLFRVLFPIKGVKDFTCGYRAYKAVVLKEALEKYESKFIDQDGFQAMVDILLKLRKMDLIFGEVPFILRYDMKASPSKMKIFSTVKKTLKLIFKRI